MAEFWSTFSSNLDDLLAPLRLVPPRKEDR